MLRRDGGREELAEQVDGAWCVRVRALGSEARHVAREEVQLLVALEVDAVRAAPAVVSLEDDGYLREWAAPMRHGSGRRAAAETSPDTAEREALGRAREDLEALLEALHGRGWVLGATPGAGLGLREDGTVVVTDLEGLRMSSAPGERRGDLTWVDSVLHDRDRTLRRRVDALAAEAAARGRAAPGTWEASWEDGWLQEGEDLGPSAAPGPADLPDPRREHRRRQWRGRVRAGAPLEEEGTLADPAEEELAPAPLLTVSSGAVTAPRPGQPAPVAARALSRPDTPVGGGRSTAAVRRAASPRARRREERARVPGRVWLAVLLAGLLLLAGAAVWVLRSGDPAATPAPGASPTVVVTEAPTIPDPVALAEQLASARHDYVTGASSTPVTLEGSAARTADEEVRRAYADTEVVGGEPEVLAAELSGTEAADGTASLRVQTEVPAHEVVRADGSVEEIAASEPSTVLLSLRWDGQAWRITEATPA